MASGMTIGRLAKEVGVNIETVRYYERRKLLMPTARKPSGYRLYGEDAARRLRFIKNAQALGFTLTEIEGLLDLRADSAAQCSDVQQRAQAKLAKVEAKRRDIEAMAGALRDLIRVCKTKQPTDRCPILKCLENGTRRSTNDNPKTKR
jgi:MerR family mercuric resistance operon transcriptional regulator/MerR family gold-responsive transcriptional activator of gol and ges genes